VTDGTDANEEITLDRPIGGRCAVEAGLYDDLRPDSGPIAAIVEGVWGGRQRGSEATREEGTEATGHRGSEA
jgi:hypothetical protein